MWGRGSCLSLIAWGPSTPSALFWRSEASEPSTDFGRKHFANYCGYLLLWHYRYHYTQSVTFLLMNINIKYQWIHSPTWFPIDSCTFMQAREYFVRPNAVEVEPLLAWKRFTNVCLNRIKRIEVVSSILNRQFWARNNASGIHEEWMNSLLRASFFFLRY